jgi:hypothetical protein
LLLAILAFPALGIFAYLDGSAAAGRGEFPPWSSALFGAVLVSTWVGERFPGRSMNEWLWTVIPAAVYVILEERAGSVAIQAAKSGTPTLVSAYVLRFFEFVVFVLAWLVVPPKRKRFATLLGKASFPWRLVLLLAGSVPIVFGTLQAHRLLGDASITGLEQFRRVQNLLVGAGCFFSVLALGRVVLPGWAGGRGGLPGRDGKLSTS